MGKDLRTGQQRQRNSALPQQGAEKLECLGIGASVGAQPCSTQIAVRRGDDRINARPQGVLRHCAGSGGICGAVVHVGDDMAVQVDHDKPSADGAARLPTSATKFITPYHIISQEI